MAIFSPFTKLRSLFQKKDRDYSTQVALGKNPFGVPSPQSGLANKGTLLDGVFDPNMEGKRGRNTWDFKAACELGFESSVWVYACVTVWMGCVATVPWIVRKLDPATGEWAKQKNHPAEKFLKAPNPFMSGGDMMERLTADLQLGGNGIWKKIYAGKKLKELWPLEMDRIRPIPDRAKFIAQYEIATGNTKTDISPKEVIHFMLPNPKDIFWGLSPMKCIEKVLECDLAALDWWVSGIYSGCRKDGVLSFKHDLTQEQFDNVVNNVRMQLLNVSGGRFPLILGHETEYTDYSMSPQEFDFTQSRAAMRNEIIAAYHMPPPLVGDLDKSSYNNLTIARKIFWLDQVLPFLERIKGVLNRSLLPDFISANDLDNYIIDFDISQVEALAEDFTTKLSQGVILQGMGVPLNVIAKRLDFDIPEIEGGDIGYVLNNYSPIGYVNKNFVPVGSLEQLLELEMSERQARIDNPPPNPIAISEKIDENDPPGTNPAQVTKPTVASSKPLAPSSNAKPPVVSSNGAKTPSKPSPDVSASKKQNFDKLFEKVAELQRSLVMEMELEQKARKLGSENT